MGNANKLHLILGYDDIRASSAHNRQLNINIYAFKIDPYAVEIKDNGKRRQLFCNANNACGRQSIHNIPRNAEPFFQYLACMFTQQRVDDPFWFGRTVEA